MAIIPLDSFSRQRFFGVSGCKQLSAFSCQPSDLIGRNLLC
jgi:hypothetical protein